MLWIEEHPNATRLERIEALAHSLIGTAVAPPDASLSDFGLEKGFDISNEPAETRQAFDEVAKLCDDCGLWYSPAAGSEFDLCEDCAFDNEEFDRDEDEEDE